MRHFLSSCIVLLTTLPAFADPPRFEPPAEIKPVGGYAIYEPGTDCKEVTYVGLDGEEPIPFRQFGGSKTAFVFPTRGLPNNSRYRFAGVASNDKGEHKRQDFSVVIGTPPVTPPPGKDPPPVVPPPSTSLYFLIVRPNGPATAAFTKVMQFPEWQELKKAGHMYKDKTQAEATLLGANLTGVTLPVVIVLRLRADGMTNEQIGKASLPLDGQGVLELPKSFK